MAKSESENSVAATANTEIRTDAALRRERRRAETRERIYEAAMSLLAERDFDSVTVEMITEAADVGKGTFFNYFDNKEAVIAYYFDNIHERLIRNFEAALNPEAEDAEPLIPGEPGPVWKRVLATIHDVAALDGQSRKRARTLISLAMTNDAVREASLSVKCQVIDTAVEMMRHGQAAGELRDDYPPEVLSSFMRNIYFSTFHAWTQEDDDVSLEQALHTNIGLAWYALRKQP